MKFWPAIYLLIATGLIPATASAQEKCASGTLAPVTSSWQTIPGTAIQAKFTFDRSVGSFDYLIMSYRSNYSEEVSVVPNFAAGINDAFVKTGLLPGEEAESPLETIIQADEYSELSMTIDVFCATGSEQLTPKQLAALTKRTLRNCKSLKKFLGDEVKFGKRIKRVAQDLGRVQDAVVHYPLLKIKTVEKALTLAEAVENKKRAEQGKPLIKKLVSTVSVIHSRTSRL